MNTTCWNKSKTKTSTKKYEPSFLNGSRVNRPVNTVSQRPAEVFSLLSQDMLYPLCVTDEASAWSQNDWMDSLHCDCNHGYSPENCTITL